MLRSIILIVSVLYVLNHCCGLWRSIHSRSNRFKTQILRNRSTIHIRQASEGGADSNVTSNDVVTQRRTALELLDCITASKDINDAEYDFDKDMRRNEILTHTDYSELKVELRSRGLKTGGDKVTMITRLLLHIIDPTVDLQELSGREVRLKYVDDDDLKSENIKIIPSSQRVNSGTVFDDPDAEDIKVLRSNDLLNSKSSNDKGKAGDVNREKVIMDGLTRQEISVPPMFIKRPEIVANIGNKPILSGEIAAYIVGGRGVLKTWENKTSAVIVIPENDEHNWKSKPVRIFADEIAFANQVVVLVPNITISEDRDCIFDNILAALDYCNKQYECKTITMAAIGRGAGKVLEILCDIKQIRQKREYGKLDWQRLDPLALLAICPSHYDIKYVSKTLNTPLFLIAGGNDTSPGGSIDDIALLLKNIIKSNTNHKNEINVRIYEDRKRSFVYLPEDNYDMQSSQDVISLGTTWLDAHARIVKTSLDSFDIDSLDKVANSNTSAGSIPPSNTDFNIGVNYIQMNQLSNNVRPSLIASHIHDKNDISKVK